MKHLSYILALVGVLIGVVLVAWFGVGNVVTAISQIGCLSSRSSSVGSSFCSSCSASPGTSSCPPAPPVASGSPFGAAWCATPPPTAYRSPRSAASSLAPARSPCTASMAHRHRVDGRRCHRRVPGADRVRLSGPGDPLAACPWLEDRRSGRGPGSAWRFSPVSPSSGCKKALTRSSRGSAPASPATGSRTPRSVWMCCRRNSA